MAALGIKYVEANSLDIDAMAIHQQLAASLAAPAEEGDLTISPEKNKPLPTVYIRIHVKRGLASWNFQVQVPASTAKLSYIAGSLPSYALSRHKALSLDPSYGSSA